MTLKPIATIEICVDCYWLSQTGNWDEEWVGRPLPTPEPLSLLHPDNVLGNPLDENGEDDYPAPHFSNSPCRTCGSVLAGDRYDMDVYSTCV